jgi:N-acetylated-alpha-linked acidic dipeptidase
VLRSRRLIGLVLGLAVPLAMVFAEPTEAIYGFRIEGSAAQRELERRFDAQLSAASMAYRHASMSSAPNHVGSRHNRLNAESTLRNFREWGWKADIETFDVLYPTPERLELELIAPRHHRARLTEDPIAGGTAPADDTELLPAYLVFSADGDVTAPLVYVNYGLAEDYATLARLGISVRGKIVLARFGRGFRGLKPKLAHQQGAVGCILYSDPADDGYAAGDPYPNGGGRPASGVQRGSVLDLPVAAGDPLTPGVGSTRSAHRLPIEQATTVTKIPVLPISYGDARHFLAALGGPRAPESWRGGLPMTYHVGPGPARAHLLVKSRWAQQRLYNVIAELTGSEWPDQWIVRGNNRDAWVYGAWVALSGHSAMMEEAKAIAALVREGWRPRRTLVYASWDGEEAGLLGSTEWVETHASELQAKAALYVNTGANTRGFLEVSASPITARLVDEVASAVEDPQTRVSVRDRALAALQVRAFASGAGLVDIDQKSAALPIGDLGAGSDFTPFAQHIGIASIDLGFGGEEELIGVYHSAYDTYRHFERFGDPGHAYGVALAQTAGRLALRAANADVFPFEFATLADRVAEQVAGLHMLVQSMRERAITQRALVGRRAFQLAADPAKNLPFVPPEDPVPDLDLRPLDTAVERFAASARKYGSATVPASSDARDSVNERLQAFEQCMTHPDGLPGRPWYRHLLSVPGVSTGYEAATLPGIREAIEAGRWEEADVFVHRTSDTLKSCADRLDQATELLASGSLE